MSRVLTPADAASSGCPLYDETKVGFGLSSPLPSAKDKPPKRLVHPAIGFLLSLCFAAVCGLPGFLRIAIRNKPQSNWRPPDYETDALTN